MAGEQLSKTGRDEVFGDMFGIMMHQAVAEGAVGMMQATAPGTPEHEKWARVAGRAVPLARDFITEAGARYEARHSDVGVQANNIDKPEETLGCEERHQKQVRLAQIEAEAAALREELGN